MANPDPRTTTDKPEARAYEMLDGPVPNPRYGGRTTRRAVIKALKRVRPKSKDEPAKNLLQLGV